MATRNLPFGFHIGIGGNANGLRDYAETLDNNNIPFAVMAADAMPYYFQEIARASNTEHFVGYRMSVNPGGQAPPSGDVNVPRYEAHPIVAAYEHTNWIIDNLPPELDGSITWIADINEPRHSEEDHPGITEWMALYSQEAARVCWERGYKYIALNYAGGNHPLWEDTGMEMRLLYQMAADNPQHLMIGTHEYSWQIQDILEGDGYLVGRIREQLVNHMQDVPVVVTEFGWSETDVPDPGIAMGHYLSVATQYYNHPSIKYAATWYLGGQFGGIADKAQQLIAPLTQTTLETLIETPEEPVTDCNCPTITDVRTTSLWIPQYGDMTDEELQQAYNWARHGFEDNNGVQTPGNHMLCPSHVDALRIHTQGLPGSILGIAYPDKIGTGVTLDWIQENCPCALEDDRQVVFLPHEPLPPVETETTILSFEGDQNWYNHPDYPGRIQVPNGFQMDVIGEGEQLYYGNITANGVEEATHLDCEFLPQQQCADGDDPLILGGIQTYKQQAVTMAQGTTLTYSHPTEGLTRVTVPINVHYHAPDTYDREEPLETDDIYVALLLNDVEVSRYQFPELLDRTWLELYGEAEPINGVVTVSLRWQTSYRNSRDLFTDEWILESDIVPETSFRFTNAPVITR